MADMRTNMPDMGPYAVLEQIASDAADQAKYLVEKQENEIDMKLATILDHDDGAKTTALARAKLHPEYQELKAALLHLKLDLRIKEGVVRAAKTSFEEWRTRSSNKRAQMSFNK